MSVHSVGTGSAWTTTLDIDQPHGLDYRELNDIRLGIGKRVGKQHVDFADTTAGGEHVRGGSSVLDIVDTTVPIIATDGTYVGGGIIYSKGVSSLFCFTTLTEYTTSTAAYEMMFAPRSICLNADFTFLGNVKFDNTVFLKDNVDISGDVLCDGSLVVLKPSEFTSAVFDGSVDISQNLHCWSKATFVNDVSINAGLIVDGTLVLKTSSLDTTGYTYLPNGVLLQWGKDIPFDANEVIDITYTITFPTDCYIVQVTITGDCTVTTNIYNQVFVEDVSEDKFTCINGMDFTAEVSFLAIGK